MKDEVATSYGVFLGLITRWCEPLRDWV